MTRAHSRWLLAIGSVLVLGAGCHHAPPAVTVAAAPATNTDSIRAAQQRAEQAARAETARRDSLARVAARADSLRRAADARRLADEAHQSLLAPVHFDFDRDELRPADRQLLDRKAAILAANPAVRIRIEGNADDRGSDEYNLALGMRRAAAAQRYLVDRGIAADRIGTASNGEERPVCSASQDEPCLGENRRDEVVVTAGGEHLQPPR
jgi:peptidoglycan-associated lipoprotein